MGTKTAPGQYDCYAAIEDDEPFFVLRAKDPHAAGVVETWASLRRTAVRMGSRPAEDLAKAEEADNLADDMREWRKARGLP